MAETSLYKNLQLQRDYVRNLPAHLKETLQWYTYTEGAPPGETIWDFNTKLRRGEDLGPKLERHFLNLTKIFSEVPPLTAPVTLYRGVDRGDVFSSDAAFASTTLRPERTIRFTDGFGCCLLQITVPPGARVLPLVDVSLVPKESEVLLDRGATWNVTGKGEEFVGEDPEEEEDVPLPPGFPGERVKVDFPIDTFYVSYLPSGSVDVTNAEFVGK